jgi:hypothetical protein
MLLPAAGCRWTAEALQKYMKSARAEAPYLPSNIQYIANNNGLKDREDVSGLPACIFVTHMLRMFVLQWRSCLFKQCTVAMIG